MSEEGFPDFSGFIRIFAVLYGFIRILISCPNFFFEKKINFLFLFFLKFIFFSFIFGFFCEI